ncbi:MAG: tRNA (N6-isopentenyl adenosine(37)-C2)-methylthiotransferase MiaB [bacterium]|nr:tRNA (N6-isopentenyl adenosine(37)-C2)-methylthiotransferase MiaB [bacterium]
MATKRYKINTFGCQMNKSDSERIKTLLGSLGMQETEEDAQADLIMYNTCSVRQTAEDRIYGQMREMEKLKDAKPDLVVAVTGCMPGRDHDGKIRERMPWVDLFFPTNEMVHIARRLAEIRPEMFEGASNREYEHYLKIAPVYSTPYSAYVPISTGCNKMCAYCVVPFARGRQVDRPVKDIVEEVKNLVASGCLEITLLGQTVNWYRPKDVHNFSSENPLKISPLNYFGALLWELNQIARLFRIHFTAPHPNHMTPDVIAGMTLPAHVNFLHLPVQSGNDEVLKRMYRPYTREQFLDVIKRVKDKLPNIALGTDIIVGFSGETPEQFEDTISLYKECDFDISYTAMYSVRSGTKAAELYKDDVEKGEKRRRWLELQKLMEQTVLRKNHVFVGTTASVLVDHFEKGICSGNSREMKRVQFKGDASLVGTIQNVKIDRAIEWILYGTQT